MPQHQPHRRVTLQDIADHLGLSCPTVSQALNGQGRIAPATRARVQQAAEELGYRPDPLLSALSRQRKIMHGASPGSVIAFISNRRNRPKDFPTLADPSLRLGYTAEVFGLEEYPSQKALTNVLRARGIAGVIVLEEHDAPVLEDGLWDDFAGVYCGPYPGNSCPFEIVRHNPFDDVTLAWNKAVEAGYRRIGFLLPTQHEVESSLEEKALASFLLRQDRDKRGLARIPPLESPFHDLNNHPEKISRWMTEEQPDVVIGAYFASMGMLQKADWRVPDDVAFIALRTREDLGAAGCLIHRVRIHNAAIRYLHGLIQGGMEDAGSPSATLVVNSTWLDGPTLPCR